MYFSKNTNKTIIQKCSILDGFSALVETNEYLQTHTGSADQQSKKYGTQSCICYKPQGYVPGLRVDLSPLVMTNTMKFWGWLWIVGNKQKINYLSLHHIQFFGIWWYHWTPNGLPYDPLCPSLAGAVYPHYASHTCAPSGFQFPHSHPHFFPSLQTICALSLSHTHTLLMYNMGTVGSGALLK